MSPFPVLSWKLATLYAGLLGLSSAFCYFIIKHIRYGSGREMVLNLFCSLQGRKSKWICDPGLARKLLHSSSSKGIGIEQLLSTKAFLPIISLESVNDEQWTRMKDNFLLLKHHLPPLDLLPGIVQSITKEYLESEEVSIIDSPTLSKIIVQSMATWLFDDHAHQEIDARLLAAIEEWRKEIAIKGQGDRKLKLFAVYWIQNKIRHNPKYYDIFGEAWFTDEYWSLLLQPFIVSPAINITDIAVTLTSPEFIKQFGNQPRDKGDMERIIFSGINYNHPFPVLERWFPDGLNDSKTGQFLVDPNTHVFLPMDKIGRSCVSNNSAWPAFGAGKRACGGKEIAIMLTTELFYELLTHPNSEEKFKPWINHKYSGRDNDLKETWWQTYFQIKTLLQVLWKLVFRKV